MTQAAGSPPASALTRAMAKALRAPRYEVIPLPGIEDEVVENVPRDIKLTVTASPNKGIEETLALAGRLAGHGFRVAPHLSARLVVDEEHLEEILGGLREQGVREVFVVAGDAPEPAGKFEGSGQLLAAMAAVKHGLEEVGITGYPESHPFISDEVTIQAMYEKAPYASYIVSQICFDAEVTGAWVQDVRARGVKLPLYIGIPGPVNRQKLMRISANIGIGESARFLKKQRNLLLRMFLPGGYTPGRMVRSLAPTLARPERNVRGFHVYTFNEVAKTEAWRRGMISRLGAAA